MSDRAGEKVGWIGGWLGGFLWVLLFSAVLLIQGKRAEGMTGVVLASIAVVLVLRTAPWKHPDTAYWKLMIPVYLALGASVVWALRSHGGTEKLGLNWWSAFLALPLLIPFVTTGRRRWNDPTPRKTIQDDATPRRR